MKKLKLSAARQDKIARQLAVWFGCGLAPKAPGTVGSLGALPLLVLALFGQVEVVLAAVVVLFAAGLWAVARVLRKTKQSDPQFVVIDEVVGQLLTFVLVSGEPLHASTLALGFVFFRFFDIVKVWPACFFDKKVHGAWGIMMDDVIAGIYAALALYAAQLLS